jgi:hypothetical protein
MGQYFLVVNLDKREFIHPHAFGDGLKLAEFGRSGDGTMFALAVLLSDGFRERGDDPVIGSWAGDRVVVTGDYAAAGRFTVDEWRNLYAVVRESIDVAARQHGEPGLYRDVSEEVRRAVVSRIEPGVFQGGVESGEAVG